MLPSDIIGQVDGLQDAAGGLRGRRHRRHDRRRARAIRSISSRCTIYLSAQGAYTDLADEFDPQVSGLFSWKNADEHLRRPGRRHLPGAQHPPRRRRGARLRHVDTGTARHGVLVPVADRLGAVPAGARPQGRQLRACSSGRATRSTSTSPACIRSSTPTTPTRTTSPGASRALGGGGTLTNATIAGRHGRRRHDHLAEQRHGRTSASCTTPSTASPPRTTQLDRLRRRRCGRATTGRCTSRSATPTPRATPTRSRSSSSARPRSFNYDLRGSAPQVSFANVDPTRPDRHAVHLQLAAPDPERRRARRTSTPTATQELDVGRAQVAQVRRQVHRPRPRPASSTRPRTAASSCRSTRTPAVGVRRRPDARAISSTTSRRRARSTRTGRSTRDAVEDILFANLATAPRVFYPPQNFSVDGEGVRRLRHGQPRRRRWRGNVGVRFVQHRPDLERQPDRRRRCASPNPFGNYDAGHGRPHLQRRPAERELRVRPAATRSCCASPPRR